MKNKIIEILKNDTFIMETENRDDYYIDNADEIAESIVKLFAIRVASHRRELLDCPKCEKSNKTN